MRGLAKWMVAVCVVVGAGCASNRVADPQASRPANWEHPSRSSAPLSQPEFLPAAPAAQIPGSDTEPLSAGTISNEWVPQTNNLGFASVPRSSLESLRDWTVAASLPGPVQDASDPAIFTIRSPQGLLTLKVGSQVARWRGMDVRLGFAPVLIRDQIYVQTADLRSTIAPLLSSAPVTFRPGVIVLDPGHGGTDSGARSASGGHEKQFTLDWALRLQKLLEADGWRVLLTRSTDVEVSLSNRVAVAEQAGADLYLSLHFNSAAPDKTGLETYVLTPAGVPSHLTRGYADELDLVLPNNSHDALNMRLAARLHEALLRVNGGRDRGIRRARFLTVLRTQNRPAVLIEGGYLSSPYESRLIASPAHRQKLAEAIAEALRAEGSSQ